MRDNINAEENDKMENTNERRKIEVVAAIIINDGKLFTTQRGYGDFKDGWEFPGGKWNLAKPENKLLQEN